MSSPAASASANSPFRGWLKLLLLAVLCCFADSHLCSAQAITITECTNLQFATLAKPSSGTQTLTVSAFAGSAGTGTILYGTPSHARYAMSCSGACSSGTFTIDIQNINSGNANVTIDSFTGVYEGSQVSFPRSGLPLSGVGHGGYGCDEFALGATATYNSAVPAGPLVPSYDVVITVP